MRSRVSRLATSGRLTRRPASFLRIWAYHNALFFFGRQEKPISERHALFID